MELGDTADGLARYAVVDVETSGLSPRRHRVLQIAVVTALSDGTVLDRWSTYVRPRFRWWFRLGPKHVHRISRRQLRSAPPLDAIVDELMARLDGKVLTAHNLDFDAEFLRRTLRRAGTELSPADELCTLRLSRDLDPGRQQSHGLKALCERYGIGLHRHHDALADAEATAQLLPHLLRARNQAASAAQESP